MGRAPCCSKVGLNRGPWTPREDSLLTQYIQVHGEGHWRSLPKKAGLLRCGKSCRLRWMNYLKPDIKRGNITPDEEDLIIRLHALLGNRWSLIAGRLPGRTDNEIKNYWNTHLSKRLRNEGTDPSTHKELTHRPPSISCKKRKRCSKTDTRGEIDRQRVHLPKPTRPVPMSLHRNHSFDSSIASGSMTSVQSAGEDDTELLLLPWSKLSDADDQYHCFLDSDEALDLVRVGPCSTEFECSSLMAVKDSSLEKLYEEYLQLLNDDEDDDKLQLDSSSDTFFVDSSE